jgi:carbon dioxide concentrating mechanism protein CcmO
VGRTRKRSSEDKFADLALGIISTQSFPAIVGIADMMLKSSGVTLVGYEKIGDGHCNAVVRGSIANVRIAIEVGLDTAEKFGQTITSTIIARPLPNLEAILPIGARLAKLTATEGRSKLAGTAIGLLETRGFTAMVGAADVMMKAADVQVAACEKIGAALCTIVIRGTVTNVAIAVEAGMLEAERIGELNAVMVIPRPLDDLENTLPIHSYWLEKPIMLPMTAPEVAIPQELELEPALELVELPLVEMPLPLVEMPQRLQLPEGDEIDRNKF